MRERSKERGREEERKRERAKGSLDGIFKAVRHTFLQKVVFTAGTYIGEIISEVLIRRIYTYVYIERERHIYIRIYI